MWASQEKYMWNAGMTDMLIEMIKDQQQHWVIY